MKYVSFSIWPVAGLNICVGRILICRPRPMILFCENETPDKKYLKQGEQGCLKGTFNFNAFPNIVYTFFISAIMFIGQ